MAPRLGRMSRIMGSSLTTVRKSEQCYGNLQQSNLEQGRDLWHTTVHIIVCPAISLFIFMLTILTFLYTQTILVDVFGLESSLEKLFWRSHHQIPSGSFLQGRYTPSSFQFHLWLLKYNASTSLPLLGCWGGLVVRGVHCSHRGSVWLQAPMVVSLQPINLPVTPAPETPMLSSSFCEHLHPSPPVHMIKSTLATIPVKQSILYTVPPRFLPLNVSWLPTCRAAWRCPSLQYSFAAPQATNSFIGGHHVLWLSSS